MLIKIIGGLVPNFQRHAFEKCDILVEDGKIKKMGFVTESTDVTIEAFGKIVSPGFIDIHMHEETFSNEMESSYYASKYELLMGVTTCVAGNCGNNRQSIERFIDYIHTNGAPVNYMTYLGHNSLRNQVGIKDRYRAASASEIEAMIHILKETLPLGIVGLSYGIEYSPGIEFEEMAALGNALNRVPYLLSAHFRSDAEAAVKSVQEMITLSEVTGLPMQISHIGSCSAYGLMAESLELIDKAVKKGIDVKADCYPYDAFATTIGSAVFDDGCFERWQKDYSAILLTEEPYAHRFCDEALFNHVRKSHPDMIVAAFVMNEDEVVSALKSPHVFIASDSLYKKNQGHPRGAGTFPRVLGKYVRDQNKLELIDALKRMTIDPAKRLHLDQKGDLKIGMDADIVIFSKERIADKADFECPTKPPEGIHYVLVNGEIAVCEGEILSVKLGKFIPYNPQ